MRCLASERIQPSTPMTHEASRPKLAHMCNWSPENMTELTLLVGVCSPLRCSPIFASHTRTEWSPEPETMLLPSGENATELTSLAWPCSSRSCSHVFASHIRTEWSSETETMLLPSGENATEL